MLAYLLCRLTRLTCIWNSDSSPDQSYLGVCHQCWQNSCVTTTLIEFSTSLKWREKCNSTHIFLITICIWLPTISWLGHTHLCRLYPDWLTDPHTPHWCTQCWWCHLCSRAWRLRHKARLPTSDVQWLIRGRSVSLEQSPGLANCKHRIARWQQLLFWAFGGCPDVCAQKCSILILFKVLTWFQWFQSRIARMSTRRWVQQWFPIPRPQTGECLRSLTSPLPGWSPWCSAIHWCCRHKTKLLFQMKCKLQVGFWRRKCKVNFYTQWVCFPMSIFSDPRKFFPQ